MFSLLGRLNSAPLVAGLLKQRRSFKMFFATYCRTQINWNRILIIYRRQLTILIWNFWFGILLGRCDQELCSRLARSCLCLYFILYVQFCNWKIFGATTVICWQCIEWSGKRWKHSLYNCWPLVLHETLFKNASLTFWLEISWNPSNTRLGAHFGWVCIWLMFCVNSTMSIAPSLWMMSWTPSLLICWNNSNAEEKIRQRICIVTLQAVFIFIPVGFDTSSRSITRKG